MKDGTHFIAGGAARFELFGVVTLAVELILVDAVGQIDEELVAGVALEAGRMPGHAVAELGRHGAERARRNVAVAPVTLLQNQPNNSSIPFQLLLGQFFFFDFFFDLITFQDLKKLNSD